MGVWGVRSTTWEVASLFESPATEASLDPAQRAEALSASEAGASEGWGRFRPWGGVGGVFRDYVFGTLAYVSMCNLRTILERCQFVRALVHGGFGIRIHAPLASSIAVWPFEGCTWAVQ